LLRLLKKHRTALIALAVYNFVLFFPVAFLGRVVSPNDVFLNYHPWALTQEAEYTRAQNSLLNDPATAYLTLMSLMKDDWRTFHWNPYIGSGIPGFGSSASAVLSPFILIPVALLPLAFSYTAIIFLKLNAAFLFAYLWLREERMGKRGAAIGAIILAGSGVYSIRWLWQITNATALYPALLWVVARTFNGKRNSIALTALLALAYALAGFPSTMAYGAWVVLAWAAVKAIGALRRRRFPLRSIAAGAVAVAIAVLVAIPSLVPFVQFLGRSGYLESRDTIASEGIFPASHLRAFVEPDLYGNPAYKNWSGDARLGALNNYVGATVYLGLAALALAVIGVFNRRARGRWFWIALAAVLLAAAWGVPYVAPAIAALPGVKYSAVARITLLLPLPAAFLAAAGVQRLSRILPRPAWREIVTSAIAIAAAFDLALFAGRFHPYLPPAEALVPKTEMVEFLAAQEKPFRVAPFFDYLWPNSAELVRVEDVRSHFGSEGDYRRMLMRVDPSAWSGASTVLTFNSLQYRFDDPIPNLLGVRWYVEHNVIDIVKWTIFGATVPAVKETGALPFVNGSAFTRTIAVDAEPFWSIEVPVTIEKELSSRSHLTVDLIKDGAVRWSRAFTKRDSDVMSKVYVPLRPYARLGDEVTLRIRSAGVRGRLAKGEGASAGDAPIYYGRVTIPLIFDRQLRDGRLFRNLAELPRFRAVSRVRKLNFEEFLAARDVDFENEAVITDDPVQPPSFEAAGARATLASYAPDEQRVVTESTAPFYLASSEKLTPELRVTIDGEPADTIETDGLFAGIVVPAGRHEVVYSRRIARGWWWAAAAGLILLIAAAVRDWRVMRRAGE
jgi:hypothetical protein